MTQKTTVSFDNLIEHLVPHAATQYKGPAWGKIAAIALVIACLAAAWRYTPLSEYVTAERIIGWAESVGNVS